jgi:outer membrane receptor protein involved in Fe transport
MRALPSTLLLASIFLWGCASGGGSSSPDVRRDPNRITQEEIQELPSGTARDAVERLRPSWLRSRGGVGGNPGYPRVFVDGRDFGTMDTLNGFHLDSVAEIEFMSGRDATTRYGTGYPGGIILVRLKALS